MDHEGWKGAVEGRRIVEPGGAEGEKVLMGVGISDVCKVLR